MRSPARLVGTVLLVIVLALGMVFAWAMPRADVALPDDDASPEDVVLAFVEAYNTRDFETAAELFPGREQLGRFDRTGSYDDVRIARVLPDPLGPERRVVQVVFRPNGLRGLADAGADQVWSFRLHEVDGAWRIVGEGAG